MPRAGLSRPIVVREAADLADATGFDGLTLAALAQRLGVAVPSLYKHVEGLDALRREVSILALGDLADVLEATAARSAGLDDAGRLAALAASYRAFAIGHPGRYAATVRAAPRGDPAHGAASDRVLRAVLDLLADRGLDGDEAIDATRSLRAGLHGFVALESAGGFGMPRDVDRSFERLVAILDEGIRAGGPGTGASASGPGLPVLELRLALTVADLDAALRLYRDALEMPVEEAWADGAARGVVLSAGRATVELITEAQAELIDHIEVGRRVAGPIRVALAVADAGSSADALVGAGAQRLGGPVVTPWGHRNARVATPDGLQLTLFAPAVPVEP